MTAVDQRIAGYEGLVRRMASSVLGFVPDHDFDDLCQQYRVVAWRALRSYDRAHDAGLTEYRYVVMCMKNREHDLKKRVRRPVDYLDEIARRESQDRFEARLMSSSAEEVYGEVEEDPLDLPSGLTTLEAEIVFRLYIGWSQADVARQLGFEKSAMTRYMRRIRLKLDDWRPDDDPAGAELEVAVAA